MSRSQVSSVTQPARRIYPKNVLVFGENSVGRSSLINLIAGQPIAATPSSAKWCTFRHQKYELQVEDAQYAIWDTAGLDEGFNGPVPAETAEGNLKQLLHDLTNAHGIHLLVYCISASHLCETLLGNYNVFYSAICRKKVPIVAVVTGLENYEQQMSDWWGANEGEFRDLKMHFDGHACVTTLNTDEVNSPNLRQRCHASRQAVLSLFAGTCARDQWRAGQESWVSAALGDVRAMLKPAQHNGSQSMPIVALCDLSERPLPIASVKDGTPFEGGRLMVLGGSRFLVYRVHDQQLGAGARFKKEFSPRGADLLILCASVDSDPGVSRQRAATFYESYGGEMRPLLIVVRDAPSNEMANVWWNRSNGDVLDEEHTRHRRRHNHSSHSSHSPGKLHTIVRALPPPGSADAPTVVAKLASVIQTYALQPVDVVPTGCFGRRTGGKRPVKLYSGSTSPIFVEDDCLTKSRIWVPFVRASIIDGGL